MHEARVEAADGAMGGVSVHLELQERDWKRLDQDGRAKGGNITLGDIETTQL